MCASPSSTRSPAVFELEPIWSLSLTEVWKHAHKGKNNNLHPPTIHYWIIGNQSDLDHWKLDLFSFYHHRILINIGTAASSSSSHSSHSSSINYHHLFICLDVFSVCSGVVSGVAFYFLSLCVWCEKCFLCLCFTDHVDHDDLSKTECSESKWCELGNHCRARYQHDHDSRCLRYFESIRWNVNMSLTYRPFSWLSLCRFPGDLHQCLYRMTVSELLFWATSITLIGMFPFPMWLESLRDTDLKQLFQWNPDLVFEWHLGPDTKWRVPTSICSVITWMFCASEFSAEHLVWNQSRLVLFNL